MEYRPYDRIEQKILGSDTGSIHFRWKWGHLVLCDDELVFPDGRLKKGAIDELIAKAAAKGTKLSRSEIQYRVQLAKTYRTEPQIAHVCGQFQSWSDLRSARFPAIEAPEDAEPYDPRAPYKKRDDAERQLNRIMNTPEANGQQPLPGLRTYLPGFTPDNIGRETLFRDAFKIDAYLRNEVTPQLRKAADQAGRDDRERGAKLTRLFDAAGRNLDSSLGAGEDALLGPAG